MPAINIDKTILRILKVNKKERQTLSKKTLLEKKRSLLESMKRYIKDQVKQDIKIKADLIKDERDQSLRDLNNDIDFTILHQRSNILRNIEEALHRLDADEYGYCENCGEEISFKRLEAVPFARYCIDCQNEMEKEEKRRSSQSYGYEFRRLPHEVEDIYEEEE